MGSLIRGMIILVLAATACTQIKRAVHTVGTGVEEQPEIKPTEILYLDGDLIRYRYCTGAVPQVSPRNCAHSAERDVHLALALYQETLAQILPITRLETELARLESQNDALTKTITDKQSRLKTVRTAAAAAKTRLASAGTEDERKRAQRSIERLQAEEATLVSEAERLQVESDTLKSGALAATRTSLAAARQQLKDISSRLSSGSVLLSEDGAAGATDLAFAPIRLAPTSCPDGFSWQGRSTNEGQCCMGSKCLSNLHPPPTCELKAAAKRFAGSAPGPLILITKGSAAFVSINGSERSEIKGQETSLSVRPDNASVEIVSRTFKASVRGVGGTAVCETTVEVDPNCPGGFGWSELRSCCAQWLPCVCDDLTMRGQLWRCTAKAAEGRAALSVRGGPCFVKGAESERLTCFEGETYD